eukprot:CAMPEP_0117696336 /NCGR_PEP_ID=MMETSP0804-20121206/28624_1 /TAXON_ID=1074897 /ORGANISM="Tetraselmis astigmatica, Strain CCMP880" /LENGTH=283 /DNA_ID=CAMNT_0005510479 /DNA_START=161 /DNA_END=1012 /DNA_ORIENTATION=+
MTPADYMRTGLVYASGVVLGIEKFSVSSSLNMLLIAFGVLICAIGEINLVLKGVVQQLLALAFEATRLALVQVLINSRGLNMNPIQSLYYVSPACMVSLAIPFCLVELPNMQSNSEWKFYPSVFLANAIAAFILNLAVFLLIGKTSALTMNIAGVIKDWMLIFFSYFLFKAPVTTVNLVGYFFCCSGVAVHQYKKLQLMKQKDALKTKAGGDDKKAEMGAASPLPIQAAASDNAPYKASAQADEVSQEKQSILEQMERLQYQLSQLESRTAAPPTDSASKQAN